MITFGQLLTRSSNLQWKLYRPVPRTPADMEIKDTADTLPYLTPCPLNCKKPYLLGHLLLPVSLCIFFFKCSSSQRKPPYCALLKEEVTLVSGAFKHLMGTGGSCRGGMGLLVTHRPHCMTPMPIKSFYKRTMAKIGLPAVLFVP